MKKILFTSVIQVIICLSGISQIMVVEGQVQIDTVKEDNSLDTFLMTDGTGIVKSRYITEVDTSLNNEIQQLSVNGDTIFISDGNYIILPGLSRLNQLLGNVQERLSNGETPCQIYQTGIPVDSLYGKFYHGGLIFDLNTTTCEVYIALSIDLNTQEFGCQGTDITGANSTSIGSGENNTISIVTNCLTNHAALESFNLNNGYDDWFLPSRDELIKVYANLHFLGMGNYANSGHWSSTQANADFAWTIYFENGNYNTATVKGNTQPFIPIRKE